MKSNPPKNFPCRKKGCNLAYSNSQNRSRHEKAARHTPVIRKNKNEPHWDASDKLFNCPNSNCKITSKKNQISSVIC